jgi:hypothetical protein
MDQKSCCNPSHLSRKDVAVVAVDAALGAERRNRRLDTSLFPAGPGAALSLGSSRLRPTANSGSPRSGLSDRTATWLDRAVQEHFAAIRELRAYTGSAGAYTALHEPMQETPLILCNMQNRRSVAHGKPDVERTCTARPRLQDRPLRCTLASSLSEKASCSGRSISQIGGAVRQEPTPPPNVGQASSPQGPRADEHCHGLLPLNRESGCHHSCWGRASGGQRCVEPRTKARLKQRTFVPHLGA